MATHKRRGGPSSNWKKPRRREVKPFERREADGGPQIDWGWGPIDRGRSRTAQDQDEFRPNMPKMGSEGAFEAPIEDRPRGRFGPLLIRSGPARRRPPAHITDDVPTSSSKNRAARRMVAKIEPLVGWVIANAFICFFFSGVSVSPCFCFSWGGVTSHQCQGSRGGRIPPQFSAGSIHKHAGLGLGRGGTAFGD